MRTMLKLKRPINDVELDLDENSIEAAGYQKVVHCKDCKYGRWHCFVDKNGKAEHFIECINTDGLYRDVADYSYCSCGEKMDAKGEKDE